MKNTLSKLRIYCTAIFLIPLFQLPSFSETANIQTGSSQRFSITLSNTMGVSTSANVTDNLSVTNEANLELLDGSIIEEQVGDDTASVTGNLGVTSEGASLDIQGLKAYNKYLIGDESFFYSKMETVADELRDPTIATQGNASSNLAHSMTIVIDQTNSSFTSSFSQSF